MTFLLTLILLTPTAFDLSEVRTEGNLERRAELALDNANTAIDHAREFARLGQYDKLHQAVLEVQQSVELCQESLEAAGKERDFLTAAEADQVRLVQEPNERLKLYTQFLNLRLELLRQSFASTKPGRSIFIHDTLEDLTRIVEAIDTVSDDALRRKVDIDKGLAAVMAAERPVVEELTKITDAPPRDYARYKFTIEQAIETLQDSVELAGQDLKTRTESLAAKDKQDKKERDEIGTETDAKEAARAADKKDAKASAADPAAQKKKAPTLRRKSEIEQQGKEKDK
jgi:hypothetical protein